MDFLEASFFDNSVRQWLISLAVAVVTATALWLFERLVIRRLGALAQRTQTEWDDLVVRVLAKTKFPLVLVVAIYAGSLVLTLPTGMRTVLTSVTVIALLLQGGIWASSALLFGLDRYKKQRLADDPATATTLSALGFLGKLAVWAVILILVLANLGVDITALVAGLGVGGIAVALAGQHVLGDLFASLAIVLDKPFVLGDFVIIEDYLGTVEHIGIKTTRMRSLSGEQLVFSNSDLLNSRIRNYGRMFERRVVFTLGVTYDTPREKLVKIPAIIRESIESQGKTRFDRSHFKEYGDFSLNFETVYYVLVREYNTYMDIQQAINLKIHERFEQAGIEFAFPTQTLYLVGQGSGRQESRS